MGKGKKLVLFCIAVELALIISIAAATLFEGLLFSVFYNFLYGLLLSVLLPLFLIIKENNNFTSVGVKKIGVRQSVVLSVFVIFSVGGQLIPRMAAGEEVAWNLLPICVVPLVMTTFFEEFLFRGFIQTRVEKQFGSFIAISVSALMFSLYHLGYPGFRTVGDSLLLLAVGLGFAIAYKLSDNNLIVSYFVNLPNAFVTYMLKSKQFPTFDNGSIVYAFITIFLIIITLIASKRKMER